MAGSRSTSHRERYFGRGSSPAATRAKRGPMSPSSTARTRSGSCSIRDERGVRRAGQPRHAARRGHGDLLGVQALRRHRRREHQAAKLNRPGRRAAQVPLLDIMAQAARECRGRHVHLGLPCTRRFSGRRVPGRGTRLRPSTGRPRTCLHLTAHKKQIIAINRCYVYNRLASCEAVASPGVNRRAPMTRVFAVLALALAACWLTGPSPAQAPVPGAGAPAAARPAGHPRMLLAASNPFTSLPALKAKYAAGERPSDDLAGWASRGCSPATRHSSVARPTRCGACGCRWPAIRGPTSTTSRAHSPSTGCTATRASIRP